jgi:hypothetical protein
MTGATLLAGGYSVILPLYEAQVLVSVENLHFYPEADPANAFAWQSIRLIAMNGGWFLFGLGLVVHTRLMGNTDPATAAASA